ncbi:hypothetical protein TNCT_84351, partial [Trichonephila clavata]
MRMDTAVVGMQMTRP